MPCPAPGLCRFPGSPACPAIMAHRCLLLPGLLAALLLAGGALATDGTPPPHRLRCIPLA